MLQQPQKKAISPIRMRALSEQLRAAQAAAGDAPARSIIKQTENCPVLPIDKDGRAFLCLVDPDTDTWTLVDSAIRRFYQIQREYPVVVLLSAFRYLTFGMVWERHFPKDGFPVPYKYGGSMTHDSQYDVVLLGKAK